MLAVAQHASKESAGKKPAPNPPSGAPLIESEAPAHALQRQTCPCGGGCPKCLSPVGGAVPQNKLTINTPGDHFELEADRVAEHVMHMPPVPRACPCGGGCHKCQSNRQPSEALQMKSTASTARTGAVAPPMIRQVLQSPGQPLDPAARAFLEPRFGHDFSHVRVHNNAEAQSSARLLHAKAYTVGSDIVFAQNQFAPSSDESMRLLAHELTHVVQQAAGGAAGVQRQPDFGDLPSREELSRKPVAGTMREQIIAAKAKSDVEKGWSIEQMHREILSSHAFPTTEERRLYAEHFLKYLYPFQVGEEISSETLRSEMVKVEKLFQGSRSATEVAHIPATAGRSTAWVDEAVKSGEQKRKERDASEQMALDYAKFVEQSAAIEKLSAGIAGEWMLLSLRSRGIGRKRPNGYYAGAAKELMDFGIHAVEYIVQRTDRAIQAAAAKKQAEVGARVDDLLQAIAAYRANAVKLSQLSDEYEAMEKRWDDQSGDLLIKGKNYADRLYEARQNACVADDEGITCRFDERRPEKVWRSGSFDESEKDRVYADQNQMIEEGNERRHEESKRIRAKAEWDQEDRFIAESEAAKHQEIFMQPLGAGEELGASLAAELFVRGYNAAQLATASAQVVNSCRQGVGECIEGAAPIAITAVVAHQALKAGGVGETGPEPPPTPLSGSHDPAYWTAGAKTPLTRVEPGKLGITNLGDYRAQVAQQEAVAEAARQAQAMEAQAREEQGAKSATGGGGGGAVMSRNSGGGPSRQQRGSVTTTSGGGGGGKGGGKSVKPVPARPRRPSAVPEPHPNVQGSVRNNEALGERVNEPATVSTGPPKPALERLGEYNQEIAGSPELKQWQDQIEKLRATDPAKAEQEAASLVRTAQAARNNAGRAAGQTAEGDDPIFTLGVGKDRAARIQSGEQNFVVDRRLTFDIDEVLPVGAPDIEPQEAAGRATSAENRQLLDPNTNQRTKGLGVDPRELPGNRPAREPVSVTTDPHALLTRRFSEVHELQRIFDRAVASVTEPQRLTPTQLKARINAETRRIITEDPGPDAAAVRKALGDLDFVREPGIGWVMTKGPAQ